MRVLYKETLLNDNNMSYNSLNDLPVINDIPIEDEVTLEMLDVYSKDEIIDLLKSLQSVHVLEDKPTDPAPNSMYYIGTESPYKLYLYDENLNEIYLGESSTETYHVLAPISMAKDQSLSVKVDGVTVQINSDGELTTIINYIAGKSIAADADNVFSLKVHSDGGLGYNIDKELEPKSTGWGATATTNGKRGVPPKRLFYYDDPVSVLGADGEWHKIQPLYDHGDLKIWPTKNIPNGWLLCDGSAVSRDVYKDLFDAIGTTYGPGDGINTFNLPDMIDRIVEGAIDDAERGRPVEAAMPYVEGKFSGGTSDGGGCSRFFSRTVTPTNGYKYTNHSAGVFVYGDGFTIQNYRGLDIDPYWSNAVYNYQGSDPSKALFPANLNLYYIIKS